MDLYEQVFKEYVAELRAAREEALRWWEPLLEREKARVGDAAAAEKSLRLRWPAGPTAYPRVIAVFRKYFLACSAINDEFWESHEPKLRNGSPLDHSLWGTEDAETEEESSIEQPRVILLERLKYVDESLADFMDRLVFIPIGADRDGRLV
jgi:hypothetical protein